MEGEDVTSKFCALSNRVALSDGESPELLNPSRCRQESFAFIRLRSLSTPELRFVEHPLRVTLQVSSVPAQLLSDQ
jgi:hypothetical protein